ncbi:discoidin domain-containing protein [Tenuifilum osseticum]|uniref:discoidin domain-containing protein n=1 Tax=Tenuifilum osseticum TaxID=3374723 RepID=UPI0034E3A76B
MNHHLKATITAALLSVLTFHIGVKAQTVTLDQFESTEGWNYIKSDGVNITVQTDNGLSGKSICITYNFAKGTGYCGIQKLFPINLPDNYEITFYIKAESPSNNFEIKFIDSTGNNVWWVNNRNYNFPTNWQKVRVKPRHISFAWGPTTDTRFRRIDRIEFTVASFVGGSGKIWIDSLTFKALPPISNEYPAPTAYEISGTKSKPIAEVLDQQPQSVWVAKNKNNQEILIDLKAPREIGGLKINWMQGKQAQKFDVLISYDSINWEKPFNVNSNINSTSYIRLPEFETRFLKLKLSQSNNSKGLGIKDIEIIKVEESNTLNNFFRYIAKNSPKGYYPRYFLEQASYWTISGVSGDSKEALINEDGMVEVEKASFSIEPVVKVGNKIYDWSNVKASQSLTYFVDGKTYDYTPTVNWHTDDIDLQVGITSYGNANSSSKLLIGYTLKNNTNKNQTIHFYLLIRPFQVNPYYQFLNLAGGVGTIKKISTNASKDRVEVDNTSLYFTQKFESFFAASFYSANPTEVIRSNLQEVTIAETDNLGLNGGFVKYTIKLKAGQSHTLFAIAPYHSKNINDSELNTKNIVDTIAKVSDYWRDKTEYVKFNLPSTAEHLLKTYRANLMYILINRDIHGIQPGSRSYERSWMRDGSLTSSALLKSGITDEVKEFIEWYAQNLYDNGKVPCVVDFRGPDPVAEHDSHGQFIYLIHEYFSFTHDTAFLRKMNPYILRTIGYIESLIAERSTDYFRYGNDSVRAFYGLVPESISHEGYSAKPMHSYWDNFFILKGLKDACDIQIALGNHEEYSRIKQVTDTFRKNLYESINLTIKNHNINYIPGCAELGDFDATSTTIALTPCNEFENLPKPEIYNTFERYYTYFSQRKTGQINWVNFTPYENRIIGSFIMLNQPERAHELIDYFLSQQRPQGWYHWAEVVWNDYRTPAYIGDMPHTWVGSDFINAFRNIFVYEDIDHNTLCIGSALKQDWIDSPQGISVQNLPTYYGNLSYSIKKGNDHYTIKIGGNIRVPANGICIRNFNGSKFPKGVEVNGTMLNTYNVNEIRVNEIPCEIKIYY